MLSPHSFPHCEKSGLVEGAAVGQKLAEVPAAACFPELVIALAAEVDAPVDASPGFVELSKEQLCIREVAEADGKA